MDWLYIPAYGLLVYILGIVIGRRSMRKGAVEYGARDPDNHSRINIHPTYELALDASKWWAIDHKVYVRRATEWRALND